MFTTQLSVTVVDSCADASLIVSDTVELEFEYTAGDDPLVISLADIESSFAVDDEHSLACQPIVFTYTGELAQGTLSLDSTLVIS